MDKWFTGALSMVQAMHYLGDIGKTKLYELIKRGEISVTRIDSKPVILKEELDEFLARASRKDDGR
jgi:excisionase family DNA binding protein